MKSQRIIITGEGGQGVQSIAKILSDTAFESGRECSFIPSFGVEQRGTPSSAFITISNDRSIQPTFSIADIVIILQERAIKNIVKFVNPNTLIVFDSSTISAQSLPKNTSKIKSAPITEYAIKQFLPKSVNIISLAIITKILEFDEKMIWKNIEVTLGKKFKNEEIQKMNKNAFEFGLKLVLSHDVHQSPAYKIKHKSLFFKGYGKNGEIVPARCKGCGICIYKCPVAALKFSNDLGVYSLPVPHVDLEKCIACGNCRNYCPDGAIGIEKEKTVKDFLKQK